MAERPLGEALDERFADELVSGMVSTDGLIGTLAGVHDESPAPEPLLPLPRGRQRGRALAGAGRRHGRGQRRAGGTPRARRARTCAAARRCWRVDGAEVTWRDDGRASTPSPPTTCWPTARPAVLDRLRDGRSPCRRPRPGRPAQGQPAARPPAGAALRPRPGGRLRRDVPPRRDGDRPRRRATRRRCAASCRPASRPSSTATRWPTRPSRRRPPHADGVRPARDAGDVRADEAARRHARDRLLDQLDEHLTEPIRDCLARDADGAPCLEVHTPPDLERELAMPGGNIFHGDLDWPWRDDGRPGRVGRRHRRSADPAGRRGRPPRRRRIGDRRPQRRHGRAVGVTRRVSA